MNMKATLHSLVITPIYRQAHRRISQGATSEEEDECITPLSSSMSGNVAGWRGSTHGDAQGKIGKLRRHSTTSSNSSSSSAISSGKNNVGYRMPGRRVLRQSPSLSSLTFIPEEQMPSSSKEIDGTGKGSKSTDGRADARFGSNGTGCILEQD